MRTLAVIVALIASLSLFLPASPATGLVPAGPVLNGGFELAVAGAQELCDTAGDQEINLIVVIIDTCSPGAMKAVHWSSEDGMVFGDSGLDGDGDREAIINAGSGVSNHNFWQAWPSPHQAYTANFDEYRFKLESGSIPAAANIQVGLSLSPLFVQHPFVLVFWEGAVMFTGSQMVPDAGGVVHLDPVTQGQVICPADYDPCLDFQSQFNAAATAAGRRALLGETRVVQDSFWNFNLGSGTVVIDDVAIVGATTPPEELP